MQIRDRSLTLTNPTLNALMIELGSECQTVLALLHQLQLPNLSPSQQATILGNLLSASIHLHTHCGEGFQNLIANEMELLPDTNEAD